MRNFKEFPAKSSCCFCKTTVVDPSRLGPIYKLKNIAVHYFCLLLSSDIQQNGRDNQGILGFMIKDIKQEIGRGKKLVCCYCSKSGATIRCWNKNCLMNFHLSCGVNKNSMHLFYDQFKSYCGKHRLIQKILPKVRRKITDFECICCYERVSLKEHSQYIWPTCCSPSTILHRKCVQALAISAGYYFKCPLCNDVRKFCQNMKELGIFIPDQDASWESEPNAFRALLQLQCDAEECRCPKGRHYFRKTSPWDGVPCSICGGCCVHIACSNLPEDDVELWKCLICSSRSVNENNNVNALRADCDISRTEENLDLTQNLKSLHSTESDSKETGKPISILENILQSPTKPKILGLPIVLGSDNEEDRVQVRNKPKKRTKKKSRVSSKTQPLPNDVGKPSEQLVNHMLVVIDSDDESQKVNPVKTPIKYVGETILIPVPHQNKSRLSSESLGQHSPNKKIQGDSESQSNIPNNSQIIKETSGTEKSVIDAKSPEINPLKTPTKYVIDTNLIPMPPKPHKKKSRRSSELWEQPSPNKKKQDESQLVPINSRITKNTSETEKSSNNLVVIESDDDSPNENFQTPEKYVIDTNRIPVPPKPHKFRSSSEFWEQTFSSLNHSSNEKNKTESESLPSSSQMIEKTNQPEKSLSYNLVNNYESKRTWSCNAYHNLPSSSLHIGPKSKQEGSKSVTTLPQKRPSSSPISPAKKIKLSKMKSSPESKARFVDSLVIIESDEEFETTGSGMNLEKQQPLNSPKSKNQMSAQCKRPFVDLNVIEID